MALPFRDGKGGVGGCQTGDEVVFEGLDDQFGAVDTVTTGSDILHTRS